MMNQILLFPTTLLAKSSGFDAMWTKFVAWAEDHNWEQTLVVLAITIVTAIVVRKWLVNLLLKVAERTQTPIDDEVIKQLGTPLYITVLVIGLTWLIIDFAAGSNFVEKFHIVPVAQTIAIVVWAGIGTKVMTQVLTLIADQAKNRGILSANLVPVFNFIIRIAVTLLAVYLLLKAWGADVSGWLASAGVLGVALGFGARDTLANLFAGVSILADTPFKKGDFITIEDGTRGKVTHVGVRTTRIETSDKIEVIIPNSIIANSRILNETSGLSGDKYRIRLPFAVAYGTSTDRVDKALQTVSDDIAGIDTTRPKKIVLRELGDSGLIFHYICWLRDPNIREVTTDQTNRTIYKLLNEAGIEIPYNKLDVYMKSQDAE
ncbi:MAG: mechanosensitive ion channel family protein [Myxococcota bacterium]|nr:mechanosensitive ion channel family protein [Myxococcota bacterium]